VKTTANSKKTAKPRGKPFPKGVSGNPAGRPKDGESWAAIYAAVGNMYTQDILDFIGANNDLGRMVAGLPKNVQLKYLTAIRVFAALLFEPSSGLLKEVMDRTEGKVTDRVDVTSGGEKIQQPSIIEVVKSYDKEDKESSE
jgi:hypothetical protein